MQTRGAGFRTDRLTDENYESRAAEKTARDLILTSYLHNFPIVTYNSYVPNKNHQNSGSIAEINYFSKTS